MLNSENRPRSTVTTNDIDASTATRYVDALARVEKTRFYEHMQRSAKIIDRVTVSPEHKEALQSFYAFNEFGLNNEEIARALNISVDQVESHIELVENKLVDQWDAFEKERRKKSRT